jgi:hypothetical protein
LSFASPTECAARTCPALFERSTFHGVPSPFATSAWRVHIREHPKLASFRPQGFSPSRRFPPRPTLRVYFTPQPHPGFALQGFSLRRSRTSSSEVVALLPFLRATYLTCMRRQQRGPGFRALLCVRVRCDRPRCYPRAAPDPLLGFTSSRSSIPCVAPPSRVLRSWSCPIARSRSCVRMTFSVSTAGDLGAALSSLTPLPEVPGRAAAFTAAPLVALRA